MSRARPSRPVSPTGWTGAARPFQATAEDPRLSRVRRLAWLLDRSIPLGGNLRIGLDPILGLIPGGGDILGSVIALYVVFEGVRLGLSWNVIVRMLGNVLVEGVVGSVPIVGDLFDAAWQANTRNVRLIERHYAPEAPARPIGRIAVGFALAALLVLGIIIGVVVWVLSLIWGALT